MRNGKVMIIADDNKLCKVVVYEKSMFYHCDWDIERFEKKGNAKGQRYLAPFRVGVLWEYGEDPKDVA